jgi:Ser/Thr protein kinase RdoA (MazF antagonist)
MGIDDVLAQLPPGALGDAASMLGSFANTAPVLVHGDPGPENFLLDPAGLGGTLVGVLDWETATGSIPAAEFAGPALFGAAGLAAFAAGYAAVGDLDAVTPERLGYFVIDRILHVFGTTGGRWNPGLDGIAESMALRLLSGDLAAMALHQP